MECSIPFTSKELKIASDIFKQAYPNGPQIKSTHLEKAYSFNEIASNIRPQLNNKLNHLTKG